MANHFEFIFACGVRKCSNFLDLPVAVQLFQQPLAEETVFSQFSSRTILLPGTSAGITPVWGLGTPQVQVGPFLRKKKMLPQKAVIVGGSHKSDGAPTPGPA